MNNDLITYKSLSYLKSGDVITSDELLKKRFFRDDTVDSINIRYSELSSKGYVAGKKKGDTIYLQITGLGKTFMHNFKYVSCINKLNAVISFVLGLLSGIVINYVSHLF